MDSHGGLPPVLDASTRSLLPVRPRLCVIDVDGTLLDSHHRVSDQTVAAVARARAGGIDVLLASSRGPRALWPILLALGLNHPAAFVGSQGAVTGSYTADGTLIISEQQPLPLPAARTIVLAALEVGLAVSWLKGPNWYVSHIDVTITTEAATVADAPVVRDLLAEQVGPDKLMVIAPAADLSGLHRVAARLPAEAMAQISNPTYLEVTRRDVDKASAVRRYCARRGIEPGQVIAFGDGPNDLGLFEFAGASIAPASARDQVLRRATVITRGNDDDGVAYALEIITDQPR